MTTLCYNCGGCHLPAPCKGPLQFCGICHQYGHTYNFCPQSVLQVEPKYTYWMLCHNCDAWHLPDACKQPMNTCTQCGHGGHLEFFCPVNPIPRPTSNSVKVEQSEEEVKTGVKRQRTSDSSSRDGALDLTPPDPNRAEHVRAIRTEAARQALQLHDQGYPSYVVLQHIAGTPMQTGSGINPVTANQIPQPRGPPTPATSVNSPLPSMNWPPASNMTGVYVSSQQRFSSGELARDLDVKYDNSNAGTPLASKNAPVASKFTPIASAAGMPASATGTPAPPAATPAPRKRGGRGSKKCDGCKGTKKKCTHQVPTPADAPTGFVPAIAPAASSGYDANAFPPSTTGGFTLPGLTSTVTAGPDPTPVNTIDAQAIHEAEMGLRSMTAMLDARLSQWEAKAAQDLAQSDATRFGSAGKKHFTYNALEGNATPTTGAGEPVNQLEQTAETTAYVSPYHLPQPAQDFAQTEGHVAVQDAADANNPTDAPVADTATETSEMPSEETQVAEKPKKGRGRPKRKA